MAEMIDAIYSSVLNPDGWIDFIARTRQWFGSSAVIYHRPLGAVEQHRMVVADLDPAFLASYNDYYARTNPWTGSSDDQHYRTVKFASGNDVWPNTALHKTEFYADWLRPQRLFHAMNANLGPDTSQMCVAFLRSTTYGELDGAERRMFTSVTTHVARALDIAGRLTPGAFQAHASLEAFERLGVAAVILDARRCIRFANASADRLLAETTCFSVHNGVLSARGEIGGRQLKAAVTAAIGSPARRRPGIGSVLAFDLGGAPMTISVTPLREKDQALLASEPLALVLMSYDNRPSIDRTALRAAYDLTDAEARLAIALPLATSASRNGDVVGKAWLYTILVNLGRSREALGVLHSMRGNDATFAEVSQLILQRRYAPALERVEAELARTENPMWIMCAVELATKLGRNDVALKYVEKGAPDLLTVRPVIARLDVPMALSAAQALARLGNHKQAERIIMSTLSGALSTDHYVIPSDYVWRSAAYALLGQRNRALLEFEEAYRQGYRLLIHRDNFMAVEDYPMFETIRTDSRFRGVLARIAQANLHASAERSS